MQTKSKLTQAIKRSQTDNYSGRSNATKTSASRTETKSVSKVQASSVKKPEASSADKLPLLNTEPLIQPPPKKVTRSSTGKIFDKDLCIWCMKPDVSIKSKQKKK